MTFFSTPPLPITDRPADERHNGGTRALAEIQMINLHDTDSPDDQANEETIAYLSTSPHSNVSVHRYIDYDGTIYKILPDTAIANQIGFSRMGNRTSLNRYALGIEFRRRVHASGWPEMQIAAGALQCLEWYGLYGLLPILYHSQIDTKGKTDPRMFPRAKFDGMFFSLLKKYL